MATTITANGINFPDGSAGTPSIGGSDTNTGLFTGSDIIGFATGGLERLKIDASGNVNIANDSGKLQLGASNDLQIYHESGQTYIQNSTGNFRIDADALRLRSKTGSEAFLSANVNGAVELYYDNSKKFETTSSGIKITDEVLEIETAASPTIKLTDTANNSDYSIQNDDGTFRIYDSTNSASRLQIASDGDIRIPSDNAKLKFGVGNDLQIYHDGSNSYIQNNEGNLFIRGDGDDIFLKAVNTEDSLICRPNGAVEIYHDGTKKFETLSDGVFVTGKVAATGDLALTSSDGQKIRMGQSNDLEIFHDGSDSHIKDAGTGGLYLSTNQFLVRNAAGTEFMIQGQEDGNVTLYHNGNQKAFTQIWGFQVNGVLAPQNDDTHDLGFSNERWDDVYATNGTINTSDRNEKNTITTSDLGLSFINKLKPVSYKFNNKTRTHYGLIAQDVETTLSDISKATSDFAGFIKEDIPDKLYEEDDDIPEGKSVGDVKTAAFTTYGLRYHEFISPLIKAMQELTAKVEALEAA